VGRARPGPDATVRVRQQTTRAGGPAVNWRWASGGCGQSAGCAGGGTSEQGQGRDPAGSARSTCGRPLQSAGRVIYRLPPAICDRARSQSVEQGLYQPIGGRNAHGTSPSACGRTSATAV